MAAADAADARTADGGELAPLHGLPVTIKDAIETAGIRSTGGAVELADHVPTHDAPAVARLRDAGAIVFGKTNLPRWSGDVQSFNELFGTTNNPWDVTRIPGGSSGGPAVAVAAGLTSFELGTDIGGSVRIPSHCCGTFGLKPSYGVVPQRGYLDSIGGGTTDADINVFGPMARSAADLDLLLSVLAGPEPARQPAWRIELPPAAATTLRGQRISVWLDDPENTGDPAMVDVLRRAVDAVSDAGAQVTEVRPPVDPATQFELFTVLVAAAVSVSAGDAADALAGQHHAWLMRDRQRAPRCRRRGPTGSPVTTRCSRPSCHCQRSPTNRRGMSGSVCWSSTARPGRTSRSRGGPACSACSDCPSASRRSVAPPTVSPWASRS